MIYPWFISFPDLHSELLAKHDDEDEFLCAIVAPLMDEDYELSEEETAKLPLQLQYYDKKREQDMTICQKLVEALYQVNALNFISYAFLLFHLFIVLPFRFK